MMPYLDGWETLNKIRDQDHLKNVPVSMLSAKKLTPEIGGRTEIEEMVDYIQKPFTIQGLTKKVNDILESLQNISREARRVGSFDPAAVEDYEVASRLERLHKSLLLTLEDDLGRAHNTFNAHVTREAISIQKQAIKRLTHRRKGAPGRCARWVQRRYLSSHNSRYPRHGADHCHSRRWIFLVFS